MTDAIRTPYAAGPTDTARSRRYSAVAVGLHWLIAFAILFQVSLAWRFKSLGDSPQGFALTQLHKSVGVTILFLSVIRLGWRLANPPPPLPAEMARWEKALSEVVHWALYVIMIGMPLTGWLMVSASRITVPTLLYGLIPWPNIPGVAALAPAAKHSWHSVGEGAHVWLSYGFYGLFVLHVGGALKHQFFPGEQTVTPRMIPGPGAGRRWTDWRLLFVIVAVIAAVALGKLVVPPNPGTPPPPKPLGPADQAQPAAAAPTPAAAAGQATAAPPGPPPATAVRWAVLPGSDLGFSTTWGGQGVSGRFKHWSADIVFSPQDLAKSHVSVSIDLASADTGDAQRDAVLPSPDWFDAAGHPKAVFTATRFEKTGEDRYVAHGTLQLRGVTRPQDLPFQLVVTGAQADVRGQTSLDRTVFGVGQGEFKATDQIPAKVAVTVSLKARRAG